MRPATKLFWLILASTGAVLIYMNLYTTSPLPNSTAFFKINRLTGSTQLCVPSIDSGVRCRSGVEFAATRATAKPLNARSSGAATRSANCNTLDPDFANLLPGCGP